jgi:hypothetical protein
MFDNPVIYECHFVNGYKLVTRTVYQGFRGNAKGNDETTDCRLTSSSRIPTRNVRLPSKLHVFMTKFLELLQ